MKHAYFDEPSRVAAMVVCLLTVAVLVLYVMQNRSTKRKKPNYLWFLAMAAADVVVTLTLVTDQVVRYHIKGIPIYSIITSTLYRTSKAAVLHIMLLWIFDLTVRLSDKGGGGRREYKRLAVAMALSLPYLVLLFLLNLYVKRVRKLAALSPLLCFMPLFGMAYYAFKSYQVIKEHDRNMKVMKINREKKDLVVARRIVAIQTTAYVVVNLPPCICFVLSMWNYKVPKLDILATFNFVINWMTYFNVYSRIARLFRHKGANSNKANNPSFSQDTGLSTL